MQKPPLRPSASEAYTLLELIVAITLLSLSGSVLLSAAKHQLDQMAVLGAREEALGLFHMARGEALARGGSDLVFISVPPQAALLVLHDTIARISFEEPYGVALGLSRGRGMARLSFGPLGLGRVTSQTLRFRRGGAEASLVVSALGRVARR